ALGGLSVHRQGLQAAEAAPRSRRGTDRNRRRCPGAKGWRRSTDLRTSTDGRGRRGRVSALGRGRALLREALLREALRRRRAVADLRRETALLWKAAVLRALRRHAAGGMRRGARLRAGGWRGRRGPPPGRLRPRRGGPGRGR